MTFRVDFEPFRVNVRERLTETCTDRYEGKFTSLYKIINEMTTFSAIEQ